MSASRGGRGRSRGALLAFALGVTLLGGALPPAAHPAPVHAQASCPSEPTTAATSPSDPPLASQAPSAAVSDQASANPAPASSGSEPPRTDTPGASPFSAPPAAPFASPDPSPAALWYAQQWQQAQALAMAQQGQAVALAQQWQAAQATLAAWSQRAVAASVLAQQTAATAAPPPTSPRLPTPAAVTPPPPPSTGCESSSRSSWTARGSAASPPGHVCQVGGDLAGSTITPLGTSGAASGSQWRVLVPAGRITAGAIATVFVPTTRGIEFFDCLAATAGAQTVCVGSTRGHGLQNGTARVHVGSTPVAQGSISGPGTAIQKLLIVVPGIDATQGTSLFDPYQRASDNFGSAVCSAFSPCTPLFPTINCPSQSGGPSTTLVPCGTSGLAWLPYSYVGVGGSGANGIPLLYTGANTGQRLALSSAAMGQIVALARALLGPSGISTQIILHRPQPGWCRVLGLGRRDAPEMPVITMDSPVNGIWPTDDGVFDTYCFNSTGLLDVYNLSNTLCRALEDVPALDSSVVPDLQASATIARGPGERGQFLQPGRCDRP